MTLNKNIQMFIAAVLFSLPFTVQANCINSFCEGDKVLLTAHKKLIVITSLELFDDGAVSMFYRDFEYPMSGGHYPTTENELPGLLKKPANEQETPCIINEVGSFCVGNLGLNLKFMRGNDGSGLDGKYQKVLKIESYEDNYSLISFSDHNSPWDFERFVLIDTNLSQVSNFKKLISSNSTCISVGTERVCLGDTGYMANEQKRLYKIDALTEFEGNYVVVDYSKAVDGTHAGHFEGLADMFILKQFIKQ